MSIKSKYCWNIACLNLIVDRFCHRPRYDRQMKIYSETERRHLKRSIWKTHGKSSDINRSKIIEMSKCEILVSFLWTTNRFNKQHRGQLKQWSVCVQWLFLSHGGAQVLFPNSVGPEQVMYPIFLSDSNVCLEKQLASYFIHLPTCLEGIKLSTFIMCIFFPVQMKVKWSRQHVRFIS